MTVNEQLFWVAMGTIAWFAIRSFSPRIAGVILAAMVIGALIKIAPQISNVGSARIDGAGGW